jgi:nucleoside phosphorylase
MTLVVAALKAELQSLIEYYKTDQKEIFGEGTLYFSEEVHLLRTGVGILKAWHSLSAYLQKYQPEKIINIGTAGALNPEFTVGLMTEPVVIKNNKAEVINPKPLFQDQFLLRKSKLITVEEPVITQKQKIKLFQNYTADIVDTEAFVLADLSRQKKIDFHCLKIISDQADENTMNDFKNNYKIIIEKLSGYLINYLNLNL